MHAQVKVAVHATGAVTSAYSMHVILDEYMPKQHNGTFTRKHRDSSEKYDKVRGKGEGSRSRKEDSKEIDWPSIDLVLVDHSANDLSLRSSYVSEEVKEMLEDGQRKDPKGWYVDDRNSLFYSPLFNRTRRALHSNGVLFELSFVVFSFDHCALLTRWAAERANAFASATRARNRQRSARGLGPEVYSSNTKEMGEAAGDSGAAKRRRLSSDSSSSSSEKEKPPPAYHISGQPVPGKPLQQFSRTLDNSASDDDNVPNDLHRDQEDGEEGDGAPFFSAPQGEEWRPLRLAVESLYR